MRKENLKRKGIDDVENSAGESGENDEAASSPVEKDEKDDQENDANDNAAENGAAKGTEDEEFEDAESGEKVDENDADDARENGDEADDNSGKTSESTPPKKFGRAKGKPVKKTAQEANGADKEKENGDDNAEHENDEENADDEDDDAGEDKKDADSDFESNPKKAKKGGGAGAKRGAKKKSPKKPVKAKAKGKKEKDVEDEEEEEEYEVEDIVDHRKERGGKMVYRIRWKNYGEADDTWEPEATLSCPDIIKKYKAKLEKEDSAPAAKRGRPSSKSAPAAKKGAGRGRKPGKKVAPKEESDEEDEEDDGKEYEVERIIDVHIKRGGVREYLVRWKGFTAKDDTWEPADNLSCADLIEKFNEKLDKSKSATVKELRVNRKHTERLSLTERGRKTSRRNASKIRVNYFDGE
ncbi:aspartic and glutamic acid-rich protein-like [Toxorhynchites rutilus septentrionalis]|uniref:aspartic and glutamic acid-rich protein-like n=1 Tax=Toxorhynchites rutilus septentrionalis TaxID=329112 RepID=UPI002478F589|nr:aspartic and glutamic acid-rich protein-like [Toxorhynchites rutilus septentrionalis]